jgi:hypothetical protein
MIANFIDPETGELYHIQSFRIKVEGGKILYICNNEILVGSKGGYLESIPKENQTEEADFTIVGSEKIGRTSEAYNKDVAFLQQRTKKHAQSEEGRYLKEQAIKREYKTMGLTHE